MLRINSYILNEPDIFYNIKKIFNMFGFRSKFGAQSEHSAIGRGYSKGILENFLTRNSVLGVPAIETSVDNKGGEVVEEIPTQPNQLLLGPPMLLYC